MNQSYSVAPKRSSLVASERSFSTLVELLRYRALHHRDQVAYTFMVDGKTEGGHLTYGELDQQARVIGGWLQQQNAQGKRALLLYPQSLEVIAAFLGCLYAGVIAIPAPAPESSRLKRTLPRLQAIAKDAQVSYVLSSEKVVALLDESRQEIQEFQQIHWLTTAELDKRLAEHWQSPDISRESIAYLQYTSGSTSTPKGVMLSHGNVLSHCASLQKSCGYTPESVTVTWMPYFHDYGLVEGLTEPLYNGTPCYVMSPFSLIRRPFNWLQTISRYRATHSQAPNFAYDLCIRRITPEQIAELDLSCWQSAGNAAEPINPNILEKFMTMFEDCGFKAEASCPAYGLAEATLLVSSSPKTEPPVIADLRADALEQGRVVLAGADSKLVRRIPSCGRLVGDTQVAIVNPQTLRRCSPDEVGEIWVCDPSVAEGYWQRPEATEQTFHAHLSDTGAGPFLRTGDLGFMQDGHLFISSRMKDVIIIRGANHYPQDIEWTVQGSHPAMRAENGGAFSQVIDGEERLVIVQEVERRHVKQLNPSEVFEAIRREIAEQHEVQVYAILLLTAGSIPKTSSGKIQRSACRQGYLNKDLETIFTWTVPSVEMPSLSGQPANAVNGLHNALYSNPFSHGKSRSLLAGVTSNGSSSNGVSSNGVSSNGVSSDGVSSDGSVAGLSQPESKAKTDELINWLRGYGNERVNSRLIDERRCIPPYIVLDLGNQGLLGMQVPANLGGLGLNNVDSVRLYEQLGAIDQSMALVVFNHNILGVRPILKYGSEEARQTLVPTLAAGRELAAFALSEPVAGSNPRAIATKAIPDGPGAWRLVEGTKYWSGMAAWAGVINVFAQTYNEQGEPQGISGFAVRQGTPGMRQGPEAMTVGMRGMIQNTIYLDGARVSQNQLLNGVGHGMDAAQDAMMFGRLVIGSFGVGGMKKCAQLMLRYATRRSVSTGRLLDNPVTLARLGELNAEITSLEVLIKRIAQLLDAGTFVPVEPYVVCKVAGAESFFKATDRLIQMLGGRGYVEPNIAPQLLRDARVCRIFEGPTETLNMYLGSRVINQGDELHHFMSNVLGCAETAQHLRMAVDQIRERSLGSHSPFSDRMSSLRWASTLAGEVAIFAIFVAVLKEACRHAEGLRLRLALDWAQLKFEQACKVALSQSATETVVRQADIVSEMIADYGETIGDLEQTLAGEDLALDPILRKVPGTSPVSSSSELGLTEVLGTTPSAERDLDSTVAAQDRNNPVVETVQAPSPLASISGYTAESIGQWITNLLSNDWKIPAATIAPDKTFSDYGLDSVMAVNLAQELEDWLDIPLEATLVWNFPTIKSLSAHLVTEINEATQRAEEETDSLTNQATEKSIEASLSSSEWVVDTSADPDLDDLSDSEMADLLAEELAAAQRRKTK